MSESNNRMFPSSDDNETDFLSFIRGMSDTASNQDDEVNDLSADHIHNKAVEAARLHQYSRAVHICMNGLNRFPNNIDLLADTVKYATDAGQVDVAQEYFERLNQIDRHMWNWRGFSFSLEYLMLDVQNNQELCHSIIEDYHSVLPNEEKAYMSESELAEKLGDHKNSMEVLVEALAKLGHAPQCALRLADLQMDCGQYSEAISSCNLGLAFCEVQPSINFPYLMLLRTLAMDALLHRRVAAGEQIETDEIKKLTAMYSFIDDIPETTFRHHQTIQLRLTCLKLLELYC